MLNANFWKGAAERAIKTFLQTFVAVVIAGLGADAVGVSAGLLDVSWLDALSVSALATILSVATSAGNADFTAGTTKVVQFNLDTEAVVEKVKADYEAKHLAE